MEANKIRLLEFLGTTKKTFNIPVYQRNYDWKSEHCIKLFKDIERIALSNFQSEHFIGTVVYVLSYAQPTYQELILIDGQQRITTITLLLKALYDAITDEDLKEDILETYLINKRAPETLRIKLKPIESDAASYQNIIENNESNIDSNIYKNYILFKKIISESSVSPINLYNAMNNIELVYIQLEKNKASENPQLIFESLNSTGLSLTQADLIRNFLLMNHSYDQQTKLYKEYWLKIEKLITNANISDFVRDYLTMKNGRIPAKEKVYVTFKEFSQEINTKLDEEGLLEDLLLYSKYYSWFINCNSTNKEINKYLSQLQQLKSTTVYPALLFIFEDCFEFHKFEEIELVKILKIVVSYLFRRLICGYPTNALNKIFASLINDMEKSQKDSCYAKILDILACKTSTGTFPRNDEFKKEFKKKDLYKTKIDKFTLFQLESYQSKEVIDFSEDITIEHIMPQKLTPSWQIELGKKYDDIHSEYLHTIGNLTLTGYNSNLSNKSFNEKKEILINSNISLSRNLTEYDSWNDVTIQDRAIKLYSIAEIIWALPEEYNYKASDKAIDYSIEFNIMDEIDVTGQKPKQIIVFDMEYNVSSWKDFLRVLCGALYEFDNDLFRSFILHNDFIGKDKRIINRVSDGMISYHKISENLYIETNLNANAIINYCKLMSEHYKAQDEIFFYLKV